MQAGLVVDSAPDDQSVYQPGGYGLVNYDWLSGFGAGGQSGFTNSLGPSAYRWADRHWGQDNSPTISADEANTKYAIPGQLDFSTYKDGITEQTAQELRGQKQDDIRREMITSRAGLGWAGRIASGLVGGMGDPTNIALAVAPEAILGKLGLIGAGADLSLGARVARGAAIGAAGNAPAIPFNYYFAQEEQRDYGIGDALMDLTVGAAVGGAAPLLHAGASSIFRRMRDRGISGDINPATVDPVGVANSSVDMRLESLSTSLQQKLAGYNVDLQPVIASTTATDDMGGLVTRALRGAQEKGARVLAGTSDGLAPPALRNADLTPYGSVAHTEGGQRVSLSWGFAGDKTSIVTPDDLNKIDRIATTMTPIEETPTSTTWRVLRAKDGRTVEYKLTDVSDNGKPGQDWHVRAVKGTRKSELSQFIDGSEGNTPRASFDEQAPRQTTPAQAQTNLVDQDNLLGQYKGEATQPGYNTRTGLPDISQPAPSVIRADDAKALDDMNRMLESSPAMKARAPDEGIGSSTPDTRELDDLAAQDDAVVDALRQAGKLTKADEDHLAMNDEVSKFIKERGKVRDIASQCLVSGGLEDIANG